MGPKELSRHQLSSKLSYQAHVPAFLQKLQNRMAGVSDLPSDENEPQFEDGELEYVGGGRPPIPRRPPIPKRPASQPGSNDERGDDDSDEEGDEKPQIIVLREGKHLSEREVEIIKRKGDSCLCSLGSITELGQITEKGLPPLPETTDTAQGTHDVCASEKVKDATKPASSKSKGLSFSSEKTTTKTSSKRKAISQLDSDNDNDSSVQMSNEKLKSKFEKEKERKVQLKKRPKKESRKLLSFGDDA